MIDDGRMEKLLSSNMLLDRRLPSERRLMFEQLEDGTH